jgi:murein DD-endopeptidase MepM/ murein hydrolase activator NlpD
MKKYLVLFISYFFFSSSIFATPETGKRVLTDNYEKGNPAIGNGYNKMVDSGSVIFLHMGVDFQGPTGSLVISPADGEVVGVQDKKIKFGSGGSYFNISARIKHAGGLESDYGHLDQVFVKEGDKVKRGTVIGTKGTSGFRSINDRRPPGYPHLHFELWNATGGRIDPMPYMVGCFNPNREYKPLEFVYPGGCSYKK